MDQIEIQDELEMIIKFLGNGQMNNNIKQNIKSHETIYPQTVFRGMKLPLAFLKEGYVIEEWYGSCHFSHSFSTALSFSVSTDLNHEYEDELIEDFGKENGVLKPVILRVKNLKGFSVNERIQELLELFNAPAPKDSYIFLPEQEIITNGYDYEIKKIETIKKEEFGSLFELKNLKEIIFIDVIQVKKG